MLTLNRLLCGCFVAMTLAASAAIADSYSPPAGQTSSVAAHHSHRAGLRLPKELKIVWRSEEKKHLKGLPKEQRHGWLKAQWRSMSEQQKQVKLAELESKWNALPASAREQILDKKRRKHEAHVLKRQEGRGEGATQPAQEH